ncbi:MAG: Dam family site-specific DNA-(adenine-N6)-methyltransferase [bacterium]
MLDACFGNKLTSISQRRYLGSKTKLLSFINDILIKEKAKYSSFADIFGGTGVVASYFNKKSDVFINDILESNYQSYVAFFGKEKIRLKFLVNKLVDYNNLKFGNIPHNYFSKNFSNTYFDSINSKIIGHIREDIENLYVENKINIRERAYLITSLIYALDRIANTVGHYDAYRKIEIPRMILELRPLNIQENKYKAKIYKQDANELVKTIYSDVVYIDPPYNSRQYSDAYHLLENIAMWKKEKVYGVAKKMDRSNIKSNYSLKSAGNSFSDLIENIDASYILVSYNDMGTNGNSRSQSRISDHEIISALERRGSVKIYERDFNQFTTGRSNKTDLKERIFFCRVTKKKCSKTARLFSEDNTHLPTYIKSPLNYTGGKHKLLPQITKYFPKEIDTFYDVFCGGANVGINAVANKIVCIDKNSRVVDLLRFIKTTNFEELNQNLIKIIKNYGLSHSHVNGYEHYLSESSTGLGNFNKKPFLLLREEYNSGKIKEKNPMLLALILYGFNNQIRFNSTGYFNLPVGKRDYNGNSRRNLANFNAITNHKNIDFKVGDFRDLNSMYFKKNDFVYLDPPYLLGLASYNESGGWSNDDEVSLYKTLLILHKSGIKFALSNVIKHKGKVNSSLIEFVNKNGFIVNKIRHNYNNSNYQSKACKSLTEEVLITNYK